MRPSTLILGTLSALVAAAGGKRFRYWEMLQEITATNFMEMKAHEHANSMPVRHATDSPSPFSNANSTKFAVNGTGIPDVDFDVGESYAGNLPIRGQENSTLFFWFFPTSNPNPKKEIVIWLNGGPGCSSLVGLLQENGPFLWQSGTFKPVENPWSWHTLTNVVWIEQPVGTGFSTGEVTADNEDDVAKQFMGFWMNFVDTFAMQGYKVYVAGESYVGMYGPYISSAFLDANDTTYFDLSGLLLYDPVIADEYIQMGVPAIQFVTRWSDLFPFNDTFRADMLQRDKDCGFTRFIDDYLVFPPKGPMPNRYPGEDDDGVINYKCLSSLAFITTAITRLNPCFNVYHITATCPLLWDVAGLPATFPYLSDGAQIYFDRSDVKLALHVPTSHPWEACTSGTVFASWEDGSPPPTLSVLPRVIDATRNVLIAHGNLDFILFANGTLLALQNMTWGGQLGFQSRPTERFYVPHSSFTKVPAARGEMGTVVSERGLTYVGIEGSGHMVPGFAPAAALRTLEFLLGRVKCLNCTEAFTTDTNAPGELE